MSGAEAPLRVAVAGAGYFSRFHYEAWSRLPVEMVACCALSGKEAQFAAREHGIPLSFTDLEEMLDQARPDLLDIVTPPPTHSDFIRAAADRGVAVVCQKPFTPSLEEAERAVALMADAGIPLIVHENFRFQPWYGEIKTLLEAGAVGDPYQVTFRLRPGDGQGPNAYLDRQPYFQRMDRFLVHETAIHFVDVFRFLCGEVAAVTAALRRVNPAIAGEDAGFILFDFDSGARGLFDGNRLADHAAENRRLTMGEMMIEGSAGTLRLDGDGRIFKRRHGGNAERTHDYEWRDTGFSGDCVFRLQSHVVGHLRGGAPAVNAGRDYLRNLRIEEAIYRSNAEGKKVEL